MFETLEAETQLGNLTKSYEKLPIWAIWAIWATGFQLKGALSSTCKTPSQMQNLEQLVTTLWRPVVPLRRVPSTREERSIYADVYPCLSMFMHFAVKAAALSVCTKLQEDTNEHSRRRQKYSHSKGACGRAIPVISILDNTMFENKMKKLTMRRWVTLASLRHILSMLVKASSVGTTPGNLQIQHFSAVHCPLSREDSTLERHRIYTAITFSVLNVWPHRCKTKSHRHSLPI